MPVKTTREPLAPGQARAHRAERLLQRGAHFGVGSRRPAPRRSCSRLATARSGCCRASSPAAASRLLRSDDDDQDRRAHPLELALQSRIGLRPRTPSRSAAAAIRRARPWRARRRRPPHRRGRARARAGRRAPPRARRAIRLLLVTSSAPSGRRRARRRVAASLVLPSWTMKTLSPATLTSSSSSAWTNAARRSSPRATAALSAAMRESLSPAAIASACGVSAKRAAGAQRGAARSDREKSRSTTVIVSEAKIRGLAASRSFASAQE